MYVPIYVLIYVCTGVVWDGLAWIGIKFVGLVDWLNVPLCGFWWFLMVATWSVGESPSFMVLKYSENPNNFLNSLKGLALSGSLLQLLQAFH